MKLRSLIGKIVWPLLGKRTRIRRRLGAQPEYSFLRKTRGVIHVGANKGQERELYDAFRLPVIWIEPIPEVFHDLCLNIQPFPSQRAINYLITDENGKEYQFHIANNSGESSSILDLSKHREIWPEITYARSVSMTSVTLPAALSREHIDLSKFDTLVLDTQGSEYTILTGAAQILPNFRFVKAEAADFEAYVGCAHIDALTTFMLSHGFREQRRIIQIHTPGIGTYFEVIYEQPKRNLR
jgi:FkbM family methyltransferase